MNSQLNELLCKQRYEQILRETEQYRLALNLAFNHPDAHRSIADKLWAGLSQLTVLSFKVIKRELNLHRHQQITKCESTGQQILLE